MKGRNKKFKIDTCSDVSVLPPENANRRLENAEKRLARHQESIPRTFQRKIPGKCKLTIKPDVRPVTITSPRRILIPLNDRVNDAIKKMVTVGFISPVDGPAEWCSPIVVTFKKYSSPKICMELRELNKPVQREYHLIPDVHYALKRINVAKYFSKLAQLRGFIRLS